MASVAFDLFLPEVLPECPGVPEPVAINAIRNASFDFCRQTLIWSEFKDAAAYTALTAEYQVAPPTGAQVVQVVSLALDDGRTLYPSTLDDIVAARPQWQTHTGPIETFVHSAPGTFRFVAIPENSGTFVAQVAYAPLRTATSVDERLYNLYLETIKFGALWKLKSLTGQSWTDPAAAAADLQLFNQGIGRAVTDRTRSNSRASLRVAPQWFA